LLDPFVDFGGLFGVLDAERIREVIAQIGGRSSR
jgi:hypothetical protein